MTAAPWARSARHAGLDREGRLAGELVTCYLFAMRLCYSGKAVHRPVDRTIGEAVAVVRRSRTVTLGMPRIGQPLPDVHPARTA